MDALADRFPQLAAIPRIRLASLPTPVERLEQTSERTRVEVWCKRDDLTSEVYGGNKVRKLEWLLGEARARGRVALVTAGAYGSHHVLATSLYGREHGFEVHAVLYPQPWSEHVEENVRVDLASGATLHPVRTYVGVASKMASLAIGLRRKGKRPYLIGPGGSSPVGAIGYVNAGIELAGQIDRGELPEPRCIYVTAGSGGTVAGLAIGLAAAGLTSRVHAVRVTPVGAINRPLLAQLVRRTAHRLSAVDPRFPKVAATAMENIHLEHSQVGPGYGVVTEASRRAMAVAAQDGLTLDTTYTAKAFAALLEGPTEDRCSALFVQTLNSADLAPLLEDAPPAPEWVSRRA